MMSHFEEELNELKRKLVSMGGLVESMIHFSIKALVDRDTGLTKEVFAKEDEVNRLQMEIDDRCLKLIALYQPTATDLRFITAAMKINSDLERMGDQAINIAETSQDLLKYPPLKPLIDLPKMADIVKYMVKTSLDAFVKKDVETAKAILLKDDDVDALKDQMFRELLTYMISDATNITRAIDLILIARNLERIGDHATNIGEDIIFMVLGKDIRHHIEDIRN